MGPISCFSQKWGSRLAYFVAGGARWKRGHRGRTGNRGNGSADIMDGQETVGNSLGRVPLGGSETEAWTSWMDRKLWEIAWGELRFDGARRKRGHPGVLDWQETAGNSLWRAPLGGSETEAWTSWTDRRPWEIAWGELRWEGARRKRGLRGRKGNRRK